MFLQKIEELNQTFKLLNNVNVILFSAWNDAASEAYKTGDLMLMESTYRNFVNDMTESSNELVNLKRDADELVEKIKKLKEEIMHIQANPEIQGCSLHRAEGCVYSKDSDEPTEEEKYFVAGWHENPEDVAWERTNLDEIKDIHIDAML